MAEYDPLGIVESESSDYDPLGLTSTTLPKEESVATKVGKVAKGILDIPERVYKEVALPFAENLTSQAVGGAGAVASIPVAARNYLTTLFETGSPERAYESASKGVKEVSDITSAWQPSTELGKESSRLSGEAVNYLLQPAGKVAKEIATSILEVASHSIPILNPRKGEAGLGKPIEDVAQTAGEFAGFGGLLKGGGVTKNLVRSILKEKKAAIPTPTEADFQAAPSGRPWFEAPEVSRGGGFEGLKAEPTYDPLGIVKEKVDVVKPVEAAVQPIEEVVPSARKWYEAENVTPSKYGKGLTKEQVDAELTKPEVQAEYNKYLDELNKQSEAIPDMSKSDISAEEEVKPVEEQRLSPAIQLGDKVYVAERPDGTNHGIVWNEIPDFEKAAAENLTPVSGWAKPDGSGFTRQTPKTEDARNAESIAKLAVETPKPEEVSEGKSGFGKVKELLTNEAGSVAFGEKKPFYSKLEEVVNMKMGGKQDVEQLKKMLKNNGVSDAEIATTVGELKGSVTKQQVLEELAVNGTKFEDVVLGEKRPYTELNRNGEQDTHYEQFTEPGYAPGSYREMFVTAPGKYNYSFALHNKIAAELNKIELELDNSTLFREARKEILSKYGMTFKDWKNFKLSGWKDWHAAYEDINNPIVRIRYNEREVNGKKILFVEEMQGPSMDNQAKMPPALQKRIYDIGVKRVLALAKEDGYDGVAWTTGEMQTNRYDLSKQLSQVEVTSTTSGKDGYTVDAVDKSGNIVIRNHKVSNAEELVNVIGKDLAKKATDQINENQYNAVFQNLDLKVGGEGLKKLYDQQLPSLFKKYGKEEVGEVVLKEKTRDDISKSIFNLKYDELFPSQRTDVDTAFLRASKSNIQTPYILITSKTPSSYTFYTGLPADQIGAAASRIYGKAKESVKDTWTKTTEVSTTAKALDEGTRQTIKGIEEKILDPVRIMARDTNAKLSFEKLSDAEEAKNAFWQRHVPTFLTETKGIKSGSFSSEQVGKALDGQIEPIVLNAKERKAYDFFKTEYDFLINEAARKMAGSEEAYQKVLKLATSEEVKKSKVSELDQASKAEYDKLTKVAQDIRKGRKVSELKGEEKEAYQEARQDMRDYLSKDTMKKLPEGEAEAYSILSRKISDYLPHLFEKGELLDAFKIEIDDLNNKLRTATNKGVVTKYMNRLGKLEKAVTQLEGGEWIRFNQLPTNVQFKFFNERKGKTGYSYDAIKAYQAYIYGIARKMFDEPALKEVAELYKGISPELKPYTKRLIDYYMGYGEKGNLNWLASNVASLEWMRTLGLNPRSAITNLTQRVNTAVYVGEKYAAKAQAMMLFDRAKANELFNKTGIAREVPQTMMEGTASNSFERVRAVVGFMFNQVELGNRKHAFIAGYLKAIDKGMSETAAIKEGVSTVHTTQFRYGKLGTAEIMRGPAGRVGLQFSSYTMKQAQFIYDLLKNDPQAFMKYVAYTSGINYVMQEFFDTDLSNALGFGINYGEALNVVKFLANGDERGAIRHLRQTVQSGGGMLPSGPGPAVSSAIKIGAAAKEGKGFEQLGKELTPIIGSRLKQAYIAVLNEEGGEYPISDTSFNPSKLLTPSKIKDIITPKGNLQYRLSARQLTQRTIGPKTEKERQESVKYEEERNLEQERKEVLSDIAKLFADGDDASIDKAVDLIEKYEISPSDEQLNNEIINRLLTKEEQGKIGKKEVYQVQREGELVRDKFQ